MDAYKSGNLHNLFRSTLTAGIKEMCRECKVPRTGGKFKLIPKLMDHVEKAAFASSDEGAITLEFASLSFARANTKFCKLEEALKKKTPRNRWSLIVAAAEGFDQVIYQAITGPDRKQYNGSHGETGIEANSNIGIAVCSAFVNVAGEMDVSEFENAIAEVITACTRCEP